MDYCKIGREGVMPCWEQSPIQLRALCDLRVGRFDSASINGLPANFAHGAYSGGNREIAADPAGNSVGAIPVDQEIRNNQGITPLFAVFAFVR
ncbi:hypothetical protein LNP05_29515 [Klebsiella pneumoniae subsp. pneumoniae]|nr:hypothetical protein [Klebsiella pneumoniae subsp. pneumoniae]